MYGGIKTILESLKVENIIVSKQKECYENFKDIIEIAKRRKVRIITVERGDKIVFDETAYANIIYPTNPLLHEDINNNSIVVKIICNGISILFTRRYRKRSRTKNIKYM